MAQEGIIYNFSISIAKITQTDIQHPLLRSILWILEDFSAGNSKENTELLNCNIVGRLFKIIEILLCCLQKCVIAPIDAAT